MHYIYEIKNKINNKRYIGRTKYPINRKNRHFKDLKDNIHHCLYLQNAYNKYGEQNFEFSILIDNLSLEDATKLEFEMINSNEELYNVSKCSTGGDLLSNNPNKDVIIKKRSKKQKTPPPPQKTEVKAFFRKRQASLLRYLSASVISSI